MTRDEVLDELAKPDFVADVVQDICDQLGDPDSVLCRRFVKEGRPVPDRRELREWISDNVRKAMVVARFFDGMKRVHDVRKWVMVTASEHAFSLEKRVGRQRRKPMPFDERIYVYVPEGTRDLLDRGKLTYLSRRAEALPASLKKFVEQLLSLLNQDLAPLLKGNGRIHKERLATALKLSPKTLNGRLVKLGRTLKKLKKDSGIP